MKNCAKRWNREKKEVERKMRESSEQAAKGLEDMLHFFRKHTDQAIYEMEKYMEKYKAIK